MSKKNLIGAASISLIACAAAVTGCGNVGHLSAASQTATTPHTSPPIDSARSNVTITIPEGATERQASAFGTTPTVVQPGTMVTWVNSDEPPTRRLRPKDSSTRKCSIRVKVTHMFSNSGKIRLSQHGPWRAEHGRRDLVSSVLRRCPIAETIRFPLRRSLRSLHAQSGR